MIADDNPARGITMTLETTTHGWVGRNAVTKLSFCSSRSRLPYICTSRCVLSLLAILAIFFGGPYNQSTDLPFHENTLRNACENYMFSA